MKVWINVHARIVSKLPIQLPINLGRFVMELFERDWYVEVNELFNFFIMPNVTLNLMVISHLYTLNDFGQFGRSDLFSYENKNYLGQVPNNFTKCFKFMHQLYYDNEKHTVEENEQETTAIPAFMKPSPCVDITENHPCYDYCKWHGIFFKKIINPEEFLTLMKLSLPQRKLKMGPMTHVEKNLASILLGPENVKETSYNMAPVPLVIFCKDRLSQKWQGDDIGMYPKFCSDFYSTPTDQGTVLPDFF